MSSGTTSTTSLVCPILQQALPDLQMRFQKLSKQQRDHDDDSFPILSPAIKEKLYKRWNPEDYNNNKNNKKRAASVLIPLYSDRNGVPNLLFTARSSNVPLNPSEISFPGGHYSLEDGDSNLIDTALRETQEELLGNYPWKDPDLLVVLGKGTTIPSITGTPVTPIIAVMMKPIEQPIHEVFPGDKNEVDIVFGMPLQQLLETEDSHELPDHRLLGGDRTGPRYPSDHGHIWGLTAFMLRPLLHKLYRPIFQLKKEKK